jgi:hypothetical protein
MGIWVKLMAKFVICRFRGRRDLALESVAFTQRIPSPLRKTISSDHPNSAGDGWRKNSYSDELAAKLLPNHPEHRFYGESDGSPPTMAVPLSTLLPDLTYLRESSYRDSS